MANALLTPDIIAKQALATLHETLVMKPLVHTDLSSEFAAQKIGDTVNVRKPVVFEAKDFDRARGIELQDATEGSIPVKLDKIADVSFVVTTEDLNLHITDFDTQLLTPAMNALAQKIDRAILGLRSDIVLSAGDDTDPDARRPWFKPEVLIEAGRLLDINLLPETDRYAVVGPTMKAEWSDTDLLKRADQSGTTEGLRRASIGRDLFNFQTFQTQNVAQAEATPAPGQSTTEIGVAFHKSAFAFVSAPLAVAPGSFAAVETFEGMSIRVAYQYDINKKQTIVSLDTLYGVKTIDANRAVLLKGKDAA